jgi:hypothetical protein
LSCSTVILLPYSSEMRREGKKDVVEDAVEVNRRRRKIGKKMQ